MNKHDNIESFLRSNKPKVKENSEFLLEVQQKMRKVNGIKAEVDRQRRYGRLTLVYALLIGLACGIIITVLAYLYPVDPEAISTDIISKTRLLIEPYKKYIMLSVALCAILLGVVLSNNRKQAYM